MYLYFDVNGNLKEFINYPVREGDDNVNKIYVYMEPSSNKVQRINKTDYSDYNFENEPIEDYVDVLVLPSIYNSWDALFKISDSDVVLNNGILLGDNIDDNYIIKQIPYDKERDLKYFSYSKYYKFIEITLTSSITQYNGRCDCTVSMLNDDPARIKKLDVFSFFIQESVVLPNTQISYAQYEYLFDTVRNAANAVPYEGATQDVNLGNYELDAGDITLQKNTSGGSKLSILAGELSQATSKIELNIDDTAYANADITVSDMEGTVHYCSSGVKLGSNNLYFPVPTSEFDEFATSIAIESGSIKAGKTTFSDEFDVYDLATTGQTALEANKTYHFVLLYSTGITLNPYGAVDFGIMSTESLASQPLYSTHKYAKVTDGTEYIIAISPNSGTSSLRMVVVVYRKRVEDDSFISINENSSFQLYYKEIK